MQWLYFSVLEIAGAYVCTKDAAAIYSAVRNNALELFYNSQSTSVVSHVPRECAETVRYETH